MSEMDDPFHKYMEEQIRSLERRLDDWIEESRRQVDRADRVLNERLETMNEFRAQILTERAEFVRTDQFDARQKEINMAFRNLEDFVANLKGRMWSIGVGAAIGTALMSTIVSLAIKYF